MKIDRAGGNPHNSAALEVSDTSRGFLPPRLTTTQMNAISSPASGLFVYNTDSSKHFYFNGSAWKAINELSSYPTDNLGNHTATSNIQLNGNYLSNDGGNEGITIANNGQVTLTPATAGAGNFAIIAGGDYRTTGVGTGYYLTNSSIGITGNNGNSGDLRLKTGGNDRFTISSGGISNFSGNVVIPSSKLGVGSGSIDSTLTVNGGIKTTYLTMTDGAGATKVLTSDANGVASWQTPSVAAVSSIQDSDNDTKIQVEESADEDIIRFDLGGTEFFRLDSGRIEVLNTSGHLFIGENAAVNYKFPTTSNPSVGIGRNALASNESSQAHLAIGGNALTNNNGGFGNIAIGNKAISSHSGGSGNVALGVQALENTTGGDDNIAIGRHAQGAKTGGSDNISIGSSSLLNNASGIRNVAIGYEAGKDNTGHSNVFLGFKAGQNDSTASQKLYIENSNSSLPLIFGDFATDSLLLNSSLTVRDSFFLPFGATNGKILTSDAKGKATWETPAAGSKVKDEDSDTRIDLEPTADGDSTTFFNNGNLTMQIRNTGTVGLGTYASTNQDVRLHLYRPTSNTEFKMESGGDNDVFIRMKSVHQTYSIGQLGIPKKFLIRDDTKGVTRLTIDTAGNMGIGTSSLSAKLTISGSSTTTARINSFGSTLSDASSLILSKARGTEASSTAVVTGDNVGRISAAAYDGSTYNTVAKIQFEVDGTPATADAPGRIQFHTTAGGASTTTERMRITNAGNVGIGTTNPKAHFQVGNMTGITSALNNAHITGNMYYDGGWKSINGGLGSFINFDYISGSIGFYTADSVGPDASYTESRRMTVVNDGKVGIGAIPSRTQDRLLVYQGGADHGYVTIENTTKEAGFDIKNDQADWLIFVDDSANNELSKGSVGFYDKKKTTVRMVIDSNGFVGFGTTNPQRYFHLNTGGSGSYMQYTNSSSGGNANDGLTVGMSGSEAVFWNWENGPTTFRTNGTEAMRISNTGNVGIGTINPTYPLHVIGDINASGLVRAGGVALVSDRRYKNNILPIEGVLNTLDQIEGVYHNWDTINFPNLAFSSERTIGLIAQDLQKVYPELVYPNSEGYLAADYAKFSAVLLQAIKEQQVLIEELKLKNSGLKSKIENQQSNIEDQTSKINEINAKLELIQKMLNEGQSNK
ncbi:MAG: tail fiber domain-containing protein [Flavobacteriales bacterium]|nr:tail fiber domain-containing protein [Flavobacteriales bacterium]